MHPHRPPRTLVTAIAAAMLAGAPLAAQGGNFEGVVTGKMAHGGTFEYYVKGNKIRMQMRSSEHPDEQGVMIYDSDSRTMTMLMPSQKMYMQYNVAEKPDLTSPDMDVKVTKMGKSDKIAGYSCDYYHVEGEHGNADVCINTDLGRFMSPGQGGPMRRGAQPPAWQKMFGDKPAFPLKVISYEKGKPEVVMEVTAVDKKSLDASAFTAPADYHKFEMPSMMKKP